MSRKKGIQMHKNEGRKITIPDDWKPLLKKLGAEMSLALFEVLPGLFIDDRGNKPKEPRK